MTFIKNKYLLYLFFVFLFLSGSLLAMEEDGIPKGKVLIKNNYSKDFLHARYDPSSPFYSILARPGIAKESVFTFEKNVEGYLIRDLNFNSYLYSTGNSNKTHIRERNKYTIEHSEDFRVVSSTRNITADSYFDIIKKDNGYVIKNKKHSDYIYISHEEDSPGNKFVVENNYIHNNSYFTFIPYNESFEGLFN